MSSLQPSADPKSSTETTRALQDHWRVFLAEGIILGVLGIAALTLPLVAGIAATVFLGWLFLTAGAVGLVATLRARRAPGFGWSLLSALVALIAGAVLLWNPLQSLATLTFVLIGFFIADGVLTIAIAIAYRGQLAGKWEWLTLNGVIDLILAGLIISGLPGTFVWLGILIGIDLVFGGAALIVMALDARATSEAESRA